MRVRYLNKNDYIYIYILEFNENQLAKCNIIILKLFIILTNLKFLHIEYVIKNFKLLDSELGLSRRFNLLYFE